MFSDTSAAYLEDIAVGLVSVSLRSLSDLVVELHVHPDHPSLPRYQHAESALRSKDGSVSDVGDVRLGSDI
jgi:hypothetical protein